MLYWSSFSCCCCWPHLFSYKYCTVVWSLTNAWVRYIQCSCYYYSTIRKLGYSEELVKNFLPLSLAKQMRNRTARQDILQIFSAGILQCIFVVLSSLFRRLTRRRLAAAGCRGYWEVPHVETALDIFLLNEARSWSKADDRAQLLRAIVFTEMRPQSASKKKLQHR